MKITSLARVVGLLSAVILLPLGAGCSSSSDDTSGSSCTTPTGTAWTPSVSGVASTNHDSSVTVTTDELTATGPLTGLGQGASSDRQISVNIDMSQDLGDYGSVTLMAEVTGFPSALQGGAYPMLVSLNDDGSSGNEFINLTSSCASSGFYSCPTNNCTVNTSCKPQWPSAYNTRDVYESHQIPDYGYMSVNTFPNCNYTDGTQSFPSNFPACAFNDSNFTVSGKLKSGKTYVAKYILLADSYKTIDKSKYTATLKVHVVKKKDTTAAVGGAVDLNVVLVGNTNVQASHTDKGKQNLDLLFQGVRDIYAQSSTNVQIGAINVYEWDCASGGDAYASTDDSQLGTLFKAGSAKVDSASEGKAINLFLVDEIPFQSGGDSNLTIAGSASMILGPTLNNLETSGVAIATFKKIDSFNPSCTLSSCPDSSQEHDFEDMKRTIAHEMGHYLGLFHPSESGGTVHDPVYDTPICTATQTVSGSSYITINSCLNTDTNTLPSTGKKCSDVCTSYDKAAGVFCPTAQECQFNHIMWWTSQNIVNGVGDGTLFSTDSGKTLNYNPFVR